MYTERMDRQQTKSTFLTHWLPFISLLITIFLLSHQPGDESSITSGRVVKFLHSLTGIPMAWLEAHYIPLIVRKIAHMTEYAVLYFFTYRVAGLYVEGRKRLLGSLMFCVLYASSDEFHQVFVPGRVGHPLDVLIDSSGAALCMLLIYFLLAVKRKAPALS